MTQKMRDALHEACLADYAWPPAFIYINARIATVLQRLGYVRIVSEPETFAAGSVICYLPERDGSREGRNDVGQTHKGLLGAHG